MVDCAFRDYADGSNAWHPSKAEIGHSPGVLRNIRDEHFMHDKIRSGQTSCTSVQATCI